MSATVTTRIDRPVGDDVRQYSKRAIFAVFAASTVTMSVLGWGVTPWLADHISSRDPFIDSLLICFTTGFVLLLTLVAVLVRRERGSLSWPNVRDGLRLRAPQSPKTGQRGGKVWWWVVPFALLSAAINAAGIDPDGPIPRDLPLALETQRLADYFHGNWSGFALLAVNALLASITEEIVFRGFLLPRMATAFGRWDVLVNGILFTVFHLHQPWSMPAVLLDGTLAQAYPSRRYRSTWISLIGHTAPNVLIITVVLFLVF
jgi:membrane protease YdiL (CAAX protease family)